MFAKCVNFLFLNFRQLVFVNVAIRCVQLCSVLSKELKAIQGLKLHKLLSVIQFELGLTLNTARKFGLTRSMS